MIDYLLLKARKLKSSQSQKGFTLIELIVVLTVIAILASIGIASFVDSSRNANLQTVQDKVVSMLNVAKSRSLSQTFPADSSKCTGSLKGYEVFFESKSKVCLTPICSINPTTADCSTGIESYTLPSDITFTDNPLPGPFYFPVLVNTIEGLTEPVQIIIEGYEKEKIITVNPSGAVSIKTTPTPSP